MAIELTPITSKTIKPQRRTRIIEISIPYGKLPSLRAHREVKNRDVDGNVVSSDNAKEVNREMANVITESFTCKDLSVVTLPQIAEALAGLIDKWETEDIAIQEALKAKELANLEAKELAALEAKELAALAQNE